jgi:hypothetical protein
MAKRCSYICTSTSSRLLGPCIYPLHSRGVRSNICATASSDTSCTFTRALSRSLSLDCSCQSGHYYTDCCFYILISKKKKNPHPNMCSSYNAVLSTVHSSRISTRIATSPPFVTLARRLLHWQRNFVAGPLDCCSEGAYVKVAPTSTQIINMAKRCSYICTSTSCRPCR